MVRFQKDSIVCVEVALLVDGLHVSDDTTEKDRVLPRMMALTFFILTVVVLEEWLPLLRASGME